MTAARVNGTGLLLLNLGTPRSPATHDVRAYLREFLSDPRVLDMPAPARWLLLGGRAAGRGDAGRAGHALRRAVHRGRAGGAAGTGRAPPHPLPPLSAAQRRRHGVGGGGRARRCGGSARRRPLYRGRARLLRSSPLSGGRGRSGPSGARRGGRRARRLHLPRAARTAGAEGGRQRTLPRGRQLLRRRRRGQPALLPRPVPRHRAGPRRGAGRSRGAARRRLPVALRTRPLDRAAHRPRWSRSRGRA